MLYCMFLYQLNQQQVVKQLVRCCIIGTPIKQQPTTPQLLRCFIVGTPIDPTANNTTTIKRTKIES